VLVLLLLAASASHPPRHETRYVFFLYPLAVIIALVTLARTAAMVVRAASWSWQPQTGAAVAAAASLAGFAVSEDFRPYHLVHVDSEAIYFRVGMKPAVASHLNARSNVRAAAQWLAENTTESDTVINSYQSLEFYYPHVDYFFMDSTDRRFSGWSCRGGTVERWGNTPLLYSVGALQAQLNSSNRVFYVLDRHTLEKMLPELQRWQPRVVWARNSIAILAFARAT
jgi:hypothetical protein